MEYASPHGDRQILRLVLVRCLTLLTGTFCATLPWESVHAAEQAVQFNTDIRPILSKNCFACHGFDAKHRQADLRLDTAEGALGADGQGGVIVPGNPEASELWQRVVSDDPDLKMPPAESHKTLTAEELATLRRWIEEGATYQRHWAFEPPHAGDVPQGHADVTHPVDRFIIQRIEAAGWEMAPEAPRETLIRRVALTLTGLPPTPADVAEFTADNAEGAYERMVDRYLDSKHFGEEMARHWLDVARYADTHGMHLDNERQTWAYRDWVVDAFNRNLSFDQFTIDQLAGDLLPEPTLDQLVATGFNRCNVTSSEGGSIDAELLYRYAVDRTSTMTQAWMGLTGGCAVCHDHKFDPITQREFYSLYAFFNSAADPAMDGNALLTQPVRKLMTPQIQAELAAIDEQIVQQQAALDAATAAVVYQDPALSEAAEPSPVEQVWMDDSFPAAGQTSAHGEPTRFAEATAEHPAAAGARYLQRTATGLAQDVWDQAKEPLTLPAQPELFASVRLDPQNPPRAIMLQYYKDGWLHRAVWGDYDAIPWGTAGTTERVHLGELPPAGQWVELSFPAEKIALAAGDALTGFALTQFGGSVSWDGVGVRGVSDPARDPAKSFAAWWLAAQGRELSELPAELKELAKQGPQGPDAASGSERLRRYYLQQICVDTRPQLGTLAAELNATRARRTAQEAAVPSTFVFGEMAEPRPAFVMLRGAYDKPGEAVVPDVPAVLPPLPAREAGQRASRLDLARWLVAPEHPLTARVAVNRIWQQMFGVGLVKSSYDFGSQGEPPSHPELLDWLAVHFRDSGWDMKQLVRLLVTSAAFRQTSAVPPEHYARDPENRLLARGPRFRLDAEQIRDNALFVSGLIQLQMGGKGVRTYQPPNIWEPVGFAGSNTRFYQQDHGEALYRRSLYVFLKRTAPPPFMSNFDAPNREQFCTRRERSNTPLQALQLMNDVQHVEAARALAERLIKEGGATAEDRIRLGYRIVLARDAQARELHVVMAQLTDHLRRYQADEAAASALITQGESAPDTTLSASEVAAYTLVANMLLNLDETLNRN